MKMNKNKGISQEDVDIEAYLKEVKRLNPNSQEFKIQFKKIKEVLK